jgi:transcriptional regulator with XRE-family HTH domain
MAPGERQSRIADLLHSYGVRRPGDPAKAGTMSIRQAAEKVGVSRETLSRLMRPLKEGETRRIRRSNLDKIADGLGIPRDLLERENMADWGYAQAIEGSDIAAILAQIRDFSVSDLAALQGEISQIQQAQLRRSAQNGTNGD